MLFYPQLALSSDVTSLEKYIDDPNWVMEQKLDGNRIVVMSPAKPSMPGGQTAFSPTVLNRSGMIYSKRLPKAITDFRFPAGSWILDGELVGDTYWVFDLPKADNDLPHTLQDRRAMLETFLGLLGHPFKTIPQARTRDEKIKLAERSLANNFEGLILKRRDSVYHPGGRNADWLKVKYTLTADVIVLAVRDDGKESAKLGLYDHYSGILTEVGRCSLIGKEKKGQVQIGDVVEVKYLYTGANGRLYQPTMLKIRDDKTRADCDTRQLKMVDKTVMETL